jgi:Tfp pilus assembly protein PilF
MMREINALKTALQTAPDNLAAWVRLGNIYHDASMFDQAVGFYEKAVALAPGDVNVITDLGVCLQEMGRFEEAVARFREAQAADPSHWQSLYNLVVVEGLALGRFDAAEASLARLEKTRPDAPRLAELRASLEEARKRPAAESR